MAVAFASWRVRDVSTVSMPAIALQPVSVSSRTGGAAQRGRSRQEGDGRTLVLLTRGHPVGENEAGRKRDDLHGLLVD
jgi:hypothetical protein